MRKRRSLVSRRDRVVYSAMLFPAMLGIWIGQEHPEHRITAAVAGFVVGAVLLVIAERTTRRKRWWPPRRRGRPGPRQDASRPV